MSPSSLNKLKIDKNKLTKRVNLIINEGCKRGFNFEIIDYQKEKVEIQNKNVKYQFAGLPEVIELIKSGKYKNWDDKDVELKKMKESGMRVPKIYGVIKSEQGLTKSKIRYPVVAKPIRGTLSKNVFVNINNKTELIKAIKKIKTLGKKIMIEEFIAGKNYRLLIVADAYIGCVERKAANITGDGVKTIKELIDQKNQAPYRGEKNELNTTNHKLVFDQTSSQILADEGLNLKSVLPKGKNLEIQKKITAGIGADYIDCTKKVNKKIVKQCLNFVKKHQLFIVGFDIITTNISKTLKETKGAFNEFNLKPYIDLNENNNIGQKHPATKIIWNKLEDKFKLNRHKTKN